MSSPIMRLYVGSVAGPLGPKTPIYTFAIRQPDGVILVDTGMDDPRDAEWTKLYPVQWRPVTHALADHGLSPADVTTVVVTHLDHDHVGNNHLFAHATVVVQEDEIEFARNRQSDEMRQLWDFPGAKLRIVRGDHQISADVAVLSSPGHTAGHQSVLVGLGQKDADLIIGDAAYTLDVWKLGEGLDDTHSAWSLQIRTDKETWLRSLNKLHQIAARRLYFSHDDRITGPATTTNRHR